MSTFEQPTTFVALDSDGCVVDTMAAKQHGFLQPLMVKTLGLSPEEERIYLACADYVNLYSVTRGISRFKAILLNFETYNQHPDVLKAGLPAIPTEDLKGFVESGLPLGNPALKQWLAEHPSPFLEKILAWSLAVNDAIVTSGATFPAYEGARKALQAMQGRSETGIVSQSPEAVLREDWGRQGVLGYVQHVAGQELGLKVAQLTALTDGRYPRDKVLMVGDAPGDLEAARGFGCRFFPILPGREEESWALFNSGVYEAFATGNYTKEAEAELIAAFEKVLPAQPPWANQVQ
ncbi:MAG: HAD family hydrolase [Kiritimatiellae bacterium]|nr:HAD family hydrolase [Kiritimatiellia bacterium]